jgi:hypothetical protein
MLRSRLALLMILLAAPASADSLSGGGFQSGGLHRGSFHGGGVSAFHHRGRRAHRFVAVFGDYSCGYNCGFGFDGGGYDYSYGNGYGEGSDYGNTHSSDYGDSYGYGVRLSNGLNGGYIPDPVGADIPPMIVRTNCWVRRAAYDPSGAYMGQALINLCRPSDNVTVTGLKAPVKAPETETGTRQPAPFNRSGAPPSPR